MEPSVLRATLRRYENNHAAENRRRRARVQDLIRLRQPVPPSLVRLSGAKAAERELCVDNWPVELQPIFVISIRAERAKLCMDRMGGLAQFATVWPGTDGRALSLKSLRANKQVLPGCKMSRGAVGCFFSHRHVWEQMVERQLPYALILEDDAALRPNARLLRNVLDALDVLETKPWELLYLGRSAKMRRNKHHVAGNVVVPGVSWGQFAYVLTLPGAERLLALPQVKQFTLPVDVVVSRLGRHDKMPIYAIHPCVVSEAKQGSDTIGIR